MLYLTRTFMFSSSHQLVSPDLDVDANQCAFGNCTNIHGHNYHLEVTVRGEADPKTGFFCNVLELKRLVDQLVVEPSDHRFLNDVPLYRGAITTMENLTQRIWGALEGALRAQGMDLYQVRLGETHEHWVSIRKD